MMLRWGYALFRFRMIVLVVSALGLALSIGTIVRGGADLSSEGFIDEEAESAVVDSQLAEAFGRGTDSLIFLFDSERPIGDPAVRTAVEAALAPLASDPRISQVLTTWTTGNPAFVADDGDATYAVALLVPGSELLGDDLEAVEHAVAGAAGANGLTVATGGGIAVGEAIGAEVEEGIVRAETVAVPLTILIQIVVFGGLIAAGVPLLVGALAIVGALAVIFALSQDSFQSIFATNIIIMLGLGLGIDYSLFMVARFREEVRNQPVAAALARSMATVGKAILFSGVTVIFGLGATQFFPLPALRSMGLAGMVVVALALIYGLTFLPALLAVLGPRINAIPVGVPARLRRRGERQAVDLGGSEGGFWHAVAEAVMRRPLAVLIPVLIALLVAGLPFLRLDLTPGGVDVLPRDSEPRQVSDRLEREFPAGEAEPLPVLVTARDGAMLSPASIAALTDLLAELSAIDGVQRVESFLTPGNPQAAYDWQSYTGDPSTLPAAVQTELGQSVRDDWALAQIVTGTTGAELEQVVREIRAQEPEGLEIGVGGFAAAAVDTVDGIRAGVVPALVFVLVGSYLILLLTFGSVFLPIKAIFMTLLSISAALGAVVLIFQDGWLLEGVLQFEATGEIISTTPILMFCILFGLSMDYEVLMLARIQEEYLRTGNNRAAVAYGLEKTAKVITGAAAIMVVVFGGFILADISIIKSMGFGLALAVLIDATIVRGLLVPATMRLMGDWNWWAPAPVKSFIARLGLAHTE